MNAGGTPRVAGVMGWPVGHSRSPRLHGFWLRAYGIDGAYVPLAVPPQRLHEALAGLVALGFAGANVTIPHKEAVAEALGPALDETARRIGAANTIVVGEDGTLHGSNTDGYGFMENLRERAPHWDAATAPAVLVGAGGAAKAIAWALLDAGVPELRIVNRTQARAAALAEALGRPAAALPWERRAAALNEAGLLVNATALGMSGQPALDLDLAGLPEDAVVSDIVYAPLETALLRAARARGLAAVDGIGMLLHQGRPGFRAWFGVEPEVTDALRAYVLETL